MIRVDADHVMVQTPQGPVLVTLLAPKPVAK